MRSGGKVEKADAALLDRIFRQFETHREGITRAFCAQSGVNPKSCQDLRKILSASESEITGIVSDGEVPALVEMGFDAGDVRARIGEDGAKALQNRVKWMADRLSEIRGVRPMADEPEARANADEVTWIVNEMEGIGNYAAGAASSLRSTIESIEDPEVKLAALNALMFSDDGDEEGDISVLTALVGDTSKEVRMAAIEWLGQIGPQKANRALETLEGVFSDEESYTEENADVRAAAVSSFVKIAYPNPRELAAALTDENFFVQTAVLAELSEKDWGDATKDVLKIFLKFLQDREGPVAKMEIGIVQLIAQKGGADAVPTLFAASEFSDEALEELAGIGDPQQILPFLREAIADTARQFQAAIVISKVGPNDPELLQAAAEVLMKKAENSEEIEKSLSALARLGEEGIKKMAFLLDDDDPRVRAMSAMWIADASKLSDAARDKARSILAEALENEEMKIGAAIAIMKIGAPNNAARRKAIGVLENALTLPTIGADVARKLLEIRGLPPKLKRLVKKVVARAAREAADERPPPELRNPFPR